MGGLSCSWALLSGFSGRRHGLHKGSLWGCWKIWGLWAGSKDGFRGPDGMIVGIIHCWGPSFEESQGCLGLFWGPLVHLSTLFRMLTLGAWFGLKSPRGRDLRQCGFEKTGGLDVYRLIRNNVPDAKRGNFEFGACRVAFHNVMS